MSDGKSSHKGFYGWINLSAASIMSIIGGLYIVSFSFFLPFLLKDFGWSRSTTSLAATINLIVMGLSGPLAGVFIVKYGAKRSILLGNILGFLGFFLLFFHARLWELYLGYGLLIGLGMGFGGLLASTTVINSWFVKKRSLALGVFLSAGGVGGMIMGPVIMALISKQGWRFTYLIMSFLVLVFAVILPVIFIKNKPQDLGQVPDGRDNAEVPAQTQSAPRRTGYKTPVDFTAKEAMRTRSLWLLIAYFSMSMLAMQALMTHQVAYLFDIGISAALAATIGSVMVGVMTLAQFGSGFIGMKFSMQSIAIGGEVLKICGIMILVSTTSVPVVFLAMIVFGLGSGAVMLAMFNILPNYFGVSSYPKIMGFVRLFWAFVGGAGAPLAGLVRDLSGSYLPAFQATVVILLAGLAFLLFAKPPVHPSLKNAAQSAAA